MEDGRWRIDNCPAIHGWDAEPAEITGPARDVPECPAFAVDSPVALPLLVCPLLFLTECKLRARFSVYTKHARVDSSDVGRSILDVRC